MKKIFFQIPVFAFPAFGRTLYLTFASEK